MNNLEQTILGQYANSPILNSFLQSMNQAIDPVNIINSFYLNVWNIDTAQGYGLDVWGRIVGVSRILTIPSMNISFGFEEGQGNGFNQQPFYSGSGSSNYYLSDSAFRLLILVKALSNINNCSASVYNKMLLTLFPSRGNAYISTNGNMTALLVFEFSLQSFEIAILKQSGAFSPPTGVNFEIMVLDLPNSFGFQEAGYSSAGFNNGIFFAGFS